MIKMLSELFLPTSEKIYKRITELEEKYGSHEVWGFCVTIEQLLDLETEERKFPDINFKIAQYYYFKEDGNEAVRQLNLGIEKIESGHDCQIPVVNYYLLRARLRHNEEDYQKAYQLNPSNIEAILGLVSIKLSSSDKKIVSSGIELILEAIRIQPEQVNLLFEYAEQAQENRYYDQAIRLYEEVLKIKKDQNVYLSKANCHSLLGEFNSALKNLDEALAIDTDFTMAQFYKANILGTQNLELALELYQQINVENLENSFKSHYWHNYARILSQLNLHSEALEKVNQAIGLNCHEVDFLKTKLHILVNLELYQEILEVCDLILSLDENFITAYTTKAISSIILEEYSQLSLIINQVLDLIRDKNQLNSELFFGLPIANNKLLDSESERWLNEEIQDILSCFLLQMYRILTEEESTLNYVKTVINNLLQDGKSNFLELNIGFYDAILKNLKNIQQDQRAKNKVWIDVLEMTLGKYRFTRDGIYLINKAIDYWNCRNSQILDKLSESEKELILNLEKK